MNREQQTARINVSDEDWIEFRTLAMRRRRSIADYLAELVSRELKGVKEVPRRTPTEGPTPARRGSSPPVRLVDQQLLTSFPRPRPKPPPWEE